MPFVDAPVAPKKPATVVKFRKTELCRYYPKCTKGQDCLYAHSEAELRVRPNFTKTRMCAGFRDGRCKLPASQCAFAHGREDLRPSGEPSPAARTKAEQRPKQRLASEAPQYIDLSSCQMAKPAAPMPPPPGLDLPAAHTDDAMTPTASGASTPTSTAKGSWGSGSCTPSNEAHFMPPGVADLTLAWLKDLGGAIAMSPDAFQAEAATVVARLRL